MKKYFFNSFLVLFFIFTINSPAQESNPFTPLKRKRASKLELPKIDPANFDKVFPPHPKNYKYPKIKKFDAILEKISPKMEFKAGTVPEITFRLMNLDLKKLVVREWMMVEKNNIIIYYTPWSKGEKIPTFDKWTELKPDIGKNPKRMPLDLKHRNSVLISTQLPFIKDMEIRTPQDFLIIGKLNLSSLPIRSRMARIRVNP